MLFKSSCVSVQTFQFWKDSKLYWWMKKRFGDDQKKNLILFGKPLVFDKENMTGWQEKRKIRWPWYNDTHLTKFECRTITRHYDEWNEPNLMQTMIFEFFYHYDTIQIFPTHESNDWTTL